jgi:hypothetical protein
MTTNRRVVSLVLALACLVPSCGGGSGPGIEFGLKRIALDLAFKDETQAKPNVAFQTPIPVASVGTFQTNVRYPNPLPVEHVDDCPAAPPGSIASTPVKGVVESLPAEGRYEYSLKGTFDLQSALLPIKGSLPQKESREVRKTKVIPGQTSAINGAPTTDTYEFEVFAPGLVSGTSSTRLYRATPTELQLVRQEVQTGDGVATFNPTPPITLMKLPATEGATWNAAGIDTDTGTSMIVQGEIEKREPVDVCGTLVDTWRVRSSERIVNLAGSSSFTSQTSDTNNAPGATGPGKPNVYHISPNIGGLLVADEEHTITHLNTTVGPVTIIVDSISTMRSTSPVKLA